MIKEMTVVGIRHYCGGEEGYPALFARIPVGSALYLRINQKGEEYPGAVPVYDDMMEQVGWIAKAEIELIKTTIRANDNWLEVKISQHCPKDNCLMVLADDQDIEQVAEHAIAPDEEEGEFVFDYTPTDQKLLQIRKPILLLLKKGKETSLNEAETERLTRLLYTYLDICTHSLDWETTMTRNDIINGLKAMEKGQAGNRLSTIQRELSEKNKDACKREEEGRSLVNQINKVRAHARDILPQYESKLKGQTKSDKDLEAVKREEKDLILAHLATSLDGAYNMLKDDTEALANRICNSHLDMRGLYVLYSRIIRLEYLEGKIAAEQKQVEEESRLMSKLNPALREKCRAAIRKATRSYSPAGRDQQDAIRRIRQGARAVDITKNINVGLLLLISKEMKLISDECSNIDFVRALVGLGILEIGEERDIKRIADGFQKKLNNGGTSGDRMPARHALWSSEDRRIGNMIYETMNKEE